MEYEKLAKKYRKKSLFDTDSASKITVNYGKQEIKKLIPHREPFLLIGTIDTIDFKEQWIIGTRHINKDDPVFNGHFPGYPIYPGVMLIEMVGQLAICYHALSKHKNIEIEDNKPQSDVRVLKILHALFQYEILPGDDITIAAKVLDFDDYKFKGIGQIRKDDKICAVGIGEFYII